MKLVGSLVYVTFTRPDISLAINIICQFMTEPRRLHLAEVIWILGFFLGNQDEVSSFLLDPTRILQLGLFEGPGWVSPNAVLALCSIHAGPGPGGQRP